MILPKFAVRGSLPAAAALAGMASLFISTASAQVLVKKDNQWRYSLGAGASLSSGNSSARSVNLTADALKATAQDKWTIYGRMLYAKNDSETTADQASLGARYDRDLSRDWFVFGSGEWLRDRPANLTQRFSASVGPGYHVYQADSDYFDVFGGVGYTRDELVAPKVIADELRSSYGRAELLLGEESQHQWTDTTTFKQRLVLYPNLQDTGSYRGVFETSLAVAMNKRLNLTASLAYRYNNDPGDGLKKADLLFVTGIAVKIE